MDAYVTTEEPDPCPHCGGRLGADGRALRPGAYTTGDRTRMTIDENRAMRTSSSHD